MIKKLIIALIILPIFCLSLTSCRDRQITEYEIQVFFFTEVNKGASSIKPYTNVEKGSKIAPPEDPVYFGHFFEGWYKDLGLTEPWDFDTDTVEKSMMLYPKWNQNKEWKIIFTLNTNTEAFTDPKDVSEEIDEDTGETVYYQMINSTSNRNLPTLRRTGYAFKGWIAVPQEQYDNTMKTYARHADLDIQNEEEFVLYPLFEAVKISLRYWIDGKETSISYTYNVTFDSVIPNLPVPNPDEFGKTGLIFLGWWTKNGDNPLLAGDWGFQVKAGDICKFTTNTVLHARWGTQPLTDE